ncbi:fungal-specific transcription factor domain-containing protein [Lipomyces orientalis]|uniref:Fungal-specific transcription factor domain-containing protein n=1 Tax=Lipomyces orientalis TaxID=1233043 RepID=A0ACC3TQI6_9ASCO
MNPLSNLPSLAAIAGQQSTLPPLQAPASSLKTHVKQQLDSQSPPSDEPPQKRIRSIAACNRCKVRKQRCDNAFPKCSNCKKAGAECVSKEQAYPASYVHQLEQHVQQLENALRAANQQKSVDVHQQPSPQEQAQESQTALLPPISAAPSPSETRLQPLSTQDQQQHQQPPSLPPINYVKTSTSSADQPASRDLIAMTHPNPPPPSYYLGSTSGFPLTKLVQAAIFGRSLPKALPIRTDMPQLPTLQPPPHEYTHQAPSDSSVTSLPPIEPLIGSAMVAETTHNAAQLKAQLTQAFLSSVPPQYMAQRLVEAYLNGVHMRYPFIYKGDIFAWSSRREEIARELATITARNPAEAAAVLADHQQCEQMPSQPPQSAPFISSLNSAPSPQLKAFKPPGTSGVDQAPPSEGAGSHTTRERSPSVSSASPATSTYAATAATPTSASTVGRTSHTNAAKQSPEYERELKSLWFKLHMIYAIGARYLQLTGTYAYIAPDIHYHIAMRYLDILSDSPLIEIIEKLLLVVVFQLRSPSGPGIWHLTGFTVRLCVEAGFHRKLNVKSALEDQRRKKIFWSLYVLERSVSVTLGRPFCIADRDIDVDLPANVDEEVRDERELEKGIATCTMNDLTSMTSAIFIMQIKRIASHIQEKIYRVDKQELPLDDKFQQLRQELDDWGESILNCKTILPLSSTPTPRLFMSEEYYMLNYHQNMRLLFVPKLPMLASDTEEFKLCLRSSGQLCQIYKRLHQYLRTVSYSFLALQASFMAGITMIYCYTKDQSILDTQFLADIRACSTVLYIIAERWPASKHFRDSFEAYVNSAIESGEFSPDKTVTQSRRESTSGTTFPVVTTTSPTAAAPATQQQQQQQQPPYQQPAYTVPATPPTMVTPTTSAAGAPPPVRFDMNLSSIIQVAQSSEPTTQPPQMPTPLSASSPAHSVASDKHLRAPDMPRPKSLLEDLAPVQDELWDILQQGTQQPDLGDGAPGSFAHPQFETAQGLGMAMGINMSTIGMGIGIGMGMGGMLGAASAGQASAQLAGSGSQVWNGQPVGVNSHQQQQQQLAMWPPLGSTIGNSVPGPGTLSATVPNPGGHTPMAVQTSPAFSRSLSAPSTTRAAAAAAIPPQQQHRQQPQPEPETASGQHHPSLQDMNAEMGVGIGNAALFRWPGDFGDLYY